MKKVIKAVICFLLNLMIFVPYSIAQEMDQNSVEMADTMRTDGKIYVVVVVVVILFTGLFIYAINTDRKLSKVEKEIKSLKSQ